MYVTIPLPQFSIKNLCEVFEFVWNPMGKRPCSKQLSDITVFIFIFLFKCTILVNTELGHFNPS